MRTLTRAIIRIMLIVMFLSTLLTFIRYLEGILVTLPRAGIQATWFEFFLLIASAIISLMILSFFWWKTNWLVNVLAGRVSNHELIITTSNVDLVKVAMRILGIWLLADSLPSLVGLIGYHIALPPQDIVDKYTHATEIKNWLFAGSKTLVGFWLVLGTRGIYRALDKLWDKTEMVHDEPKQED
jgi:hypothetical protein